MEHVSENMRSFPLIYNIAPLRDVNVDKMQELRRAADEAQNEIILQAAQGPCVIIGRRADQVLRDKPNLVRIFVTAEMEDRIRNVCEDRNLEPEEAQNMINAVDQARSNYYGTLNGKVWGQADNYDLCINTSVMGEEGALYTIRNAVEGKLIHMSKAAT